MMGKRWQNLFHQKCPNCGEQMEISGKYFKCPVVNDEGMNCFFISREKAAQYLTDKTHPAYINLTGEEKRTLEDQLHPFG